MNTCDSCGAQGPKVTIADGCPECGTLVGWPVPDGISSASVIAAYDVVATDEQLEDALRDVALRNLATLMRRKRKAEAARGFKAEVDDADSEAGEPVQDQERSGNQPDQGGGQEAAAGGESEPAQSAPTAGDAPQTP